MKKKLNWKRLLHESFTMFFSIFVIGSSFSPGLAIWLSRLNLFVGTVLLCISVINIIYSSINEFSFEMSQEDFKTILELIKNKRPEWLL